MQNVNMTFARYFQLNASVDDSADPDGVKYRLQREVCNRVCRELGWKTRDHVTEYSPETAQIIERVGKEHFPNLNLTVTETAPKSTDNELIAQLNREEKIEALVKGGMERAAAEMAVAMLSKLHGDKIRASRAKK